jgi:hypothetical protein
VPIVGEQQLSDAAMTKPSKVTRPSRIAVVVAMVSVVLALAGIVVNRSAVQAEATQVQVEGVISEQPDEQVVLDDGSASYYLVSPIDLAPYFGTPVVLFGVLVQGTLYVQELTLGTIDLKASDSGVSIDAIGIVDEFENGFRMTTEGIVFSLYGGDAAQFIGQSVEVTGAVTGRDVTVAEVHPA